MTDDDSGRTILSRRARFIAAALAGAGLAAASCSGGGGDGPQVCLSPPTLEPDDAGQGRRGRRTSARLAVIKGQHRGARL